MWNDNGNAYSVGVARLSGTVYTLHLVLRVSDTLGSTVMFLLILTLW